MMGSSADPPVLLSVSVLISESLLRVEGRRSKPALEPQAHFYDV